MDNKRITHVVTDDLSKLEPRMIGFCTSGLNDSALSEGNWGGRNSSGHVSRFTEYSEPARFDKVFLNGRILITNQDDIHNNDYTTSGGLPTVRYAGSISLGENAGGNTSAADINIGYQAGLNMESYYSESWSDPEFESSIGIGDGANNDGYGDFKISIGSDSGYDSNILPSEVVLSYTASGTDYRYETGMSQTSGTNVNIGFLCGAYGYQQNALTMGSEAGIGSSNYRTTSIGTNSTGHGTGTNATPWVTSADEPLVLIFPMYEDAEVQGGSIPPDVHYVYHNEGQFIGPDSGVNAVSRRVIGVGEYAFTNSIGANNVAIGSWGTLESSEVTWNVGVGSSITQVKGFCNVVLGSKSNIIGALEAPTINDHPNFAFFHDNPYKWGHNIFVGGNHSNHKSNYDVCLGYGAGSENGTFYSERNIFIGYSAGSGYDSYGMENVVCIGDDAGSFAGDLEDSVIIGNNAGHNCSNATNAVYIGNTAGATTLAFSSIVIGDYARSSNSSDGFGITVGNYSGNNAGCDDTIVIGAHSFNDATSPDSTNIIIGNNTFNFSRGAGNVIMGNDLYNNDFNRFQTLNLNSLFIGDFVDNRFGTDKSVVSFTPLSSDPLTPSKGELYYNSTSNHFFCYDGTTWQQIG